jgi:hypothetical protein
MGKKINAHKILVSKCQREIDVLRTVRAVWRITFAFIFCVLLNDVVNSSDFIASDFRFIDDEL